MGPVARFREHLVLGYVRKGLAEGEQIRAWTHASVPGVRAPALLVVTDHRCLVHVASTTVSDRETPLGALLRFELDRDTPEKVRVRLAGNGDDVVAELSLTSRARSRAAGRVLSELTRRNVGAPETFDPNKTSPLPPVPRGMKDHARRVWVTVVGVLVLVLSLAFASPFLPGPGAFTAVAGFAILAKEYEWARDVHVWATRQAERFVRWMQDRFRRRRERRSTAEAGGLSVEPTPAPEDGVDEGYRRTG